MTIYPEYMDTLDYANIQKGQVPFYCLYNRILNEIPLHHHDFAELSFVVEGSGTETLNGITHELKPGSLSFLLPHQMHEFRSSLEHPIQVYCCMFDMSLIFEAKTDIELGQLLLQAGERYPSFIDLDGRLQQEMTRNCKQLFAEYKGTAVGKNSAIRSLIMESLLIYVRSHVNSAADHRHNQPLFMNPGDWKIIQYVHTHYLNSLTLNILSSLFEVSPSYISRLFTKYLGHSFVDYLHLLRIRRASSLLLTTAMTISDIALDAGFETFRTFSRVFKELKHMTPSEFRQSFSRPGGQPLQQDPSSSSQ